MNPEDNDKKKKKKTPDDYKSPFDFFGSDEIDINKIMEDFIPFLKGSSFGKMIDEMLKNLMNNFEGGLDPGMLENMSNNPFVYGFKIGVDEDGKPNFNQFGNLKPKAYGDIETSETREPLIDVFKEKDCVRVIAEVPGISKGDISLTGTEETLRIRAHSESRKYEKAVSLPTPVDISTAKAKYKNGVLEVIIKRKKNVKKDKGHKIDVE
ncbi:MAG: Hsp20/alpha crystallin family protein [Candidatus Heimdallarchaeota archaeon]|nr:Hsp20/alpha crystallin family protein [Candidatus Heimdallarchaeota archaeon]MCG3258025.1 Hsp20/alpha crystallin family protein [Candidatus Heimdallarchaeota archaeon]MCK4613074.1 Hsp20/alpha crystallin family protein [Candidatus Heimdallarchaeota archaeon]